MVTIFRVSIDIRAKLASQKLVSYLEVNSSNSFPAERFEPRLYSSYSRSAQSTSLLDFL